MSQVADIDGWRLTMPAGGWLWKYDDSSFHRNQFQNFAGGSKAMDAVALEANGTLWLIELKDYRRHRRTKPSSMFDEVAGKVRATLAGLITAKVRANDTAEKTLAQQAFGSSQIRVALQVAQPDPPSRLFPQVVDPQDAALALKRAVRAVDAHPICAVGDMNCASLPWTTSAIQHTGV
jgi:hypothetical protein